MPCEAASTFVGGGDSLRLLPFFLSGWVTSATTLWRDVMSARREPIENSADPKNTIFILPQCQAQNAHLVPEVECTLLIKSSEPRTPFEFSIIFFKYACRFF